MTQIVNNQARKNLVCHLSIERYLFIVAFAADAIHLKFFCDKYFFEGIMQVIEKDLMALCVIKEEKKEIFRMKCF